MTGPGRGEPGALERWLRDLLLLCYPRRFRERYRGEMEEAFRRLRERALRRHGRPGVAALWARLGADAIAAGVGERLRTTGPRVRERTMNGMQHLWNAVRGLRRTPGYAAAFAVTLGLAIGVNSAVFSVVNGVLLEPLPFEDADRIMYMKQPARSVGVENQTFSFLEIADYRAASRTVDEFVEFGDWTFSVVGEGEPHRAVGGLVTSNYFEVLGLEPVEGRVLVEEDDRRGAAPVVVLTHAYWTRVFGADPAAVGSMVELTGVRSRIVGVLEPGMHYTGTRRPDFYVNYATNDHYQSATMEDERVHRMTDVFARLAPGAELSDARLELAGITARLHAAYPEAYPADLGYALEVVPWRDQLTREARPTFLLLMATVGAVLLLACANVTNLTLARLVRKENELATRGALGASATDLRVELTAENVVLAVGGSLLGLVLALVSRDALVAYAGRFTVRAQEVGVDWTVVGFTLLGAVAVAVVLAWLPGLPVSPAPRQVASSASRATHGRWRTRVQRGLVVTQLALSFTLLAGAGLLVRSLLALQAVDPGFETRNVLTVQAPGAMVDRTEAEETALFGGVLERVRDYPGVRAAAVALWAPLSGHNPISWSVRVDGGEAEGRRSHLMALNNVSPGYFDVLGMQLLEGRFLDHGDRAESDTVIVINESMARAHFGEGSALGRRMAFAYDGRTWSPWARVVGVVADAREHGIGRAGIHTVYRPPSQTRWGPTFLIATDGDVAPLTRFVTDAVHELDPTRPVDRVQTLDELRAESVAPSRLNATLFGAFAVLALLIAGVGVLGVLGFSVSQRVREFGVRMALGAERWAVLRSVLGEGLAMVALALAVGGVGAFVVGRLLSGLLFAVRPVDPVSLLTAGGLLAVVALGAAFLPARRATRIPPSQALRGR